MIWYFLLGVIGFIFGFTASMRRIKRLLVGDIVLCYDEETNEAALGVKFQADGQTIADLPYVLLKVNTHE